MTTLTIRFIHGDDIVSGLIGYATDSLWTHTEVLSRDGKSWIGAHAGTGVQARPLDWANPTREAVYTVPVTDEEANEAYTWLEGQIGKPYSYPDIVGLALHVRVGLNRHAVICSALVLEFLWKASQQPLNVLEGYEALITPETLHLSPIFIGRKIHR